MINSNHNKWQTVKLGEVLTVLTDYHANGSYKKLKANVELLDTPDYAVMIRTTNFEKRDFEQDLKYIKESAYEFLKKSVVKPDDILMNKIANAGSVYYMPNLHRPVSLAMNLFLLRTLENKTNQQFIYYYLKSNESYIKQYAIGTAAKTITKESVRNLKISLPPLPVQNKIASILSAYDDLIENNTRRIKILESMAQTLYQEWFVKFRFPGHEQVKMVESNLGLIPEGWEVKKLGNIADINKKNINKNNAPERINYINITSVSPGRINKIETMDFDDAPSRARRLVGHGDIIWSTVRPNRKSYSLILNPIENLVASTGFAVISAKETAYSYLYHVLTTDDFVHYLTNNATGSAYPAVNTNDFRNADIVVPEKNTVERFSSIIEDMLFEKENLQQKNDNLRKTRDLLLPKLISGQIDVENLDIDTGELAA